MTARVALVRVAWLFSCGAAALHFGTSNTDHGQDHAKTYPVENGPPRKTVVVHIPKTGGTSLGLSLKAIGELTNISYIDCFVPQWSLENCLNELDKDRFWMYSGEFVSNHFVRLMNHSSKIQLWSMLRNPIVRTLSQLEHVKEHGNINEVQIQQFLRSPRCPLNRTFCHRLGNERRCYAGGFYDPCSIFTNHQAGTLGETSEVPGKPRMPLNVALRRFETRAIRPLITEYYQASLCLMLHVNMRGDQQKALAPVFDMCCRSQNSTKEGCPVLRRENKHEGRIDYVRTYLSDPTVRELLPEKAWQDCILYQKGFEIFVRDVREMEAQAGVKVLPSSESGRWFCKAWIAEHTLSS